MARKSSSNVRDNISENYYQISAEVLGSFPKYRLPLDLFAFQEDILVLAPYSRKGQRLTNEQVEEIRDLCRLGLLFVSRSDLPIYSEHMVKQLDLVLQDANLKEAEVADICVRALLKNFDDFASNPVKISFDPIYTSLMVVTEWLWQDKHRIRYFLRRMQSAYTLANHAFNTMAIGLWLWRETAPDDAPRRTFDRVALALLLHDMGMTKIPQIIVTKRKELSGEEREKVNMHPLLGYRIMQKLDLAFAELAMCTMEHHERMDGSGYPQKTKGTQISELGRLVAVADSFSAMIAERPHSKPMDLEEAAKILAQDKARFDAKYTAKILLGVVNKVIVKG